MLEVRFRKGAAYLFFDVPLPMFEQFVAAPSKGAYFVASIKGRFRYTKLGL